MVVMYNHSLMALLNQFLILLLRQVILLYLTLFPIVGYLAIPIGVVVSGYLKNYLLGRACHKRGLAKHDGRTLRSIIAFGAWAVLLGLALNTITISSIWVLGLAIGGYGIIYLPVAYLIDRKIHA